MECKSARSSELDLLGFRNFFSELDHAVPKAAVSAAFSQFDARRVGSLNFRDICFGLGSACISSWEVRSRFLFDMFGGTEGGISRAHFSDLLTAIVSAVCRANLLGDTDVSFSKDEMCLEGLEPPSLERIQSCVSAAESATSAAHAFTHATAPEVAPLSAPESAWISDQLDQLFTEDQTFVLFANFLPWSCRNCQFFFKFLELFEIVPSPDRERRTCARLLAGTVPVAGSTWYVVSYKWIQLWKSYVRWTDADSVGTVWSAAADTVSSPRSFDYDRSPPNRSIIPAMSSLDAMSCTSTVIQQRMSERPLGVNNSDLEATELKGALKPNLIEHHDYLLVPEEMWNLLVDWYGGGPAFPRKPGFKKIQRRLSSNLFTAIRPSVLELYPPLILVVLCGADGIPVCHFTRRFFVSRGDTVSDLVGQLARKVGNRTNANGSRLWHRRSGESWELIQDDDPRIMDDFASAESAGTFMLEMKGENGQWPRKEGTSEDANVQVGDRVDAQSADQSWRTATVVDVAETSVKVHFDGEEYKLDAWLQFDEIAPMGTQTATHVTKRSGSFLKLFDNQSCAGPNGPTGLSNIGNTCFMNATLQCLAATPMLKEYFATVARPEGKIVKEFAALMTELSRGRLSVAPTAFKRALDKFTPAFAGFEHQDAHELLALLLDGLHEDLNVGRPESGTSDAWLRHRAQHSSVIADLFDGQQRISTQCRDCGYQSFLFEAFRYVMLPVPVTEFRQVVVYLVLNATALNLRPKFFKLVVYVSKTALMQSVISALSQTYTDFQIDWDQSIVLAEVYLSRIHRYIDITTPVSEFRSDDKIFAYVVQQHTNSENNTCWQAQIIQRRERVTKKQRRTSFRKEIFAVPIVFSVVPGWTQAQLFAAVRAHMARFVSVTAKGPAFTLRMISPDGVSCSGCGRCEGGCLVNPNSNRLVSGPWLYLAVDWISESFYDSSMESVMISPKPSPINDEPPPTRIPQMNPRVSLSEIVPLRPVHTAARRAPHHKLNLYDCMDAYTGAEELGGENQWLCDKCKCKCDAERKISWWVAPDILVILLKRFQYTPAGFEKINVSIQFPLTDLVLKTATPESYELYGVVNHFGSLSAGHYTALCRGPENGWFNFNDHHVAPVANLTQELENGAKSCYVLFYKRKGNRPANVINYATI